MPRGYVYMLTNHGRTAVYTGVTSNLTRRMEQHLAGEGGAFTSRYRTNVLVFIQPFDDIRDAIAYEKKVKAGSRADKDQLIASMNPTWRDLMEEINGL